MDELVIEVEISYWSILFGFAPLWLPFIGVTILLFFGINRGEAFKYFFVSVFGVVAIYLLVIVGVVTIGEARHFCESGCAWAEDSYHWLTRSSLAIAILEMVTLGFVLIMFILAYRSIQLSGTDNDNTA